MSALEPGIYRAAVRGVPDQLVTISADGDHAWALSQDSVGGTRYHPQVAVTDARPLIVLDPTRFDASWVCRVLLKNSAVLGASYVVAQIEAQTKPSRIEEPMGAGAVVDAALASSYPGNASRWVRGDYAMHAWHCGDSRKNWDDLIDPALVREGLS